MKAISADAEHKAKRRAYYLAQMEDPEYRETNRKRAAEWYAEHKDKAKSTRQAYYEANWDGIREQQRQYNNRPEARARVRELRSTPEARASKKRRALAYLSDPDNKARSDAQKKQYRSTPKAKQVRAKRDAERKASDPNYKLACVLRSRLKQAVRGGYKSGSAVGDLGCSIDELKIHLQTKFELGMSWDNYGKGDDRWNIDHIIPLSAFDLTNRQHVVLACHFLNLRPLWHKDNIAKKAAYPEDLLLAA